MSADPFVGISNSVLEPCCGEILWPFGCYKDKPLKQIPSSYLVFLVKHSDGRNGELLDDVQDELSRRRRNRRKDDLAGVVTLWQRKMTTRHRHPKAQALIKDGAQLLATIFGINHNNRNHEDHDDQW
jgi:hypothetical protein